MARVRSSLLLGALLVLAVRWVAQAFLPCPQEAPRLPSIGAHQAAAAAATLAAAPLSATAADEYLNYNFAGEFTPYMIIGYFGTTTAMTAIAFLSYLILTKLKII
eukprot:TRINITY_DN7432_c0_g3_i1.p1 TRINITY_DN7432_c0_g3~~TRINITY_DN7432_c0_g3_i1.p1  ORF type:complete len:121 (+),score=21.37 TRINITY_DN7432_c0_g3_i1:51-365(+)